MKTNSKQFREIMINHIMENASDEHGNSFKSIEQAAKSIYSEFERTANYPYNLKRLPNDQNRFSDWLCGLPSLVNQYYYDSDISDFLNSTGINPENKEFDSNISMKRYHYFIYREILKYK